MDDPHHLPLAQPIECRLTQATAVVVLGRRVRDAQGDLVLELEDPTPATRLFGVTPEELSECLRVHLLGPEGPDLLRCSVRVSRLGRLVQVTTISVDATRVVLLVEDVTDQERTQRALGESEERARLAVAAAQLGTFRLDVRTGSLALDAVAREHLGVDRDSVSVADIIRLTHEADRERVGAALAAGFDPERGQVAVEHRVCRADGTVRWLSIKAIVRFGEPDAGVRRPILGIATSQDVTSRRVAEEALRLSEERYRSLVENIDGVVFSTNVAGVVTFASPAVRRYGWTPAEVIGRRLQEIVHPEDLPALLASRVQRMQGGEYPPYDFRLLDREGGVHHVRSMTRPLVVDRVVAGLTGVLVDVTQQRATEEQLRFAQKMEAIGRLAGGVAHDFNNLLSVIGMYAELAIEQLAPGAPEAEDLEQIRRAGLRAQALTRQLLAFSRRQILKLEPVDLNELVSGVEKMLMRVIGEDVELAFEPGLLVGRTMADPGQLEQVLMNLVINSRDALPRGGRIVIQTFSRHLTAPWTTVDGTLLPGAYVGFAVTDDGTGMDERTRARMFEPFFTTKPAGKGTGLGLAMVYGTVQQSGGGIEVESTVGTGTTIRVCLPADPALARGAAAADVRDGGRGTEVVLIVEDEEALGRLMERVLSAAGYEVLVARSGEEAIRLFRGRADVRLLVTDVVMPEIDGPALAARLRAFEPELCVLYVSGYSDEVVTHRGVLSAEVDLLEKPFTSHTLLGRVRQVLDRPR